jgi:hypothetical protein
MTLRAVERGSIKFIQGQSRRREVQGRNRYPLASLGRDVCRNSLDAAHNSGEMSKALANLEEHAPAGRRRLQISDP